MKIRKKLIISIIIILIAVVYSTLFIKMYGESSSNGKVPEKSEVKLNDNLNNRTGLGMSTLSENKQKHFNVLNNRLAKEKFYGAIIGISQNQVKYSVSYGYANRSTQSVFQVGTTFFVGKYQSILNNMQLLSLRDQGNLSLKAPISRYLPKVKSQLTIGSIMNDSKKIYVKKSSVKRRALIEKQVKLTKHSRPGYIETNNIIKSMIISKFSHSSYEHALIAFLVKKFGVTDTRFFEPSEKQVNDATSYTYYESNGLPIQQKTMAVVNENDGLVPLRMSLSDFIVSVNSIAKSKYYEELKRLAGGDHKEVMRSSSSKKSFCFYENGQELRVLMDKNVSEMVVVATNFPNKRVLPSNLINELYSKY